MRVGARGLLRSAVRDAVFFSLPRGLLERYGSLILGVRAGGSSSSSGVARRWLTLDASRGGRCRFNEE
ncbi:MAG: hypothetical protein QXD46_05445 [Thermofilum sp.]